MDPSGGKKNNSIVCNGDDPVAVTRCLEMAVEWRHEWGIDVIIYMICYRRNGHNELGARSANVQTAQHHRQTNVGCWVLLSKALAATSLPSLLGGGIITPISALADEIIAGPPPGVAIYAYRLGGLPLSVHSA